MTRRKLGSRREPRRTSGLLDGPPGSRNGSLTSVARGIPSGRSGWSGQRVQAAHAVRIPRWKAGLQGDDLVGPVSRASSVSADATGRCRWWSGPCRASVMFPPTGRVALTETTILVWVEKPKGASGVRRWKHQRGATDSPVEQSPEVGGRSTARPRSIRSRIGSRWRGSSLTTRGKWLR